ncbi:MAG: DNA-processing protein DprA [Thermodesulfobacteriota bacterium]
MGEKPTARSSAELLDWLALRLIPGVGSVTYARLLGAFGSPGAALGAPLKQLLTLSGLRESVARAVHQRAFAVDPQKELAALERMGAVIVRLGEPEYPPLLAKIYAPPPLLFVRGSLAGCADGGVAVVGSRSMSPYGRRLAGELGRDLAQAGVSLISGLARGVDAVAHRGALAAGGHTVGVLGCGLNVAYPREHQELIVEVARAGAVVSEFPLNTPPAPGNFPVRNRIISGLSRAVVVVEAGLKSGSLITARHALDQGREMFAVPGPVGAPQSAGCNALISQGARLLTSARDILAPGSLPPVPSAAAAGPEAAQELAPAEAALLSLIGQEPVHIDNLARSSGLGPGELSMLLLHLVLSERILELPGKHYVVNV